MLPNRQPQAGLDFSRPSKELATVQHLYVVARAFAEIACMNTSESPDAVLAEALQATAREFHQADPQEQVERLNVSAQLVALVEGQEQAALSPGELLDRTTQVLRESCPEVGWHSAHIAAYRFLVAAGVLFDADR